MRRITLPFWLSLIMLLSLTGGDLFHIERADTVSAIGKETGLEPLEGLADPADRSG